MELAQALFHRLQVLNDRAQLGIHGPGL